MSRNSIYIYSHRQTESITISVDAVCLLDFMAAAHCVCVTILCHCVTILQDTRRIVIQTITKTDVPARHVHLKGEHTGIHCL